MNKRGISTNLFSSISNLVKGVLVRRLSIRAGLAGSSIISEAVAQEFRAEVEGISKGFVSALKDVTTGHENLVKE